MNVTEALKHSEPRDFKEKDLSMYICIHKLSLNLGYIARDYTKFIKCLERKCAPSLHFDYLKKCYFDFRD